MSKKIGRNDRCHCGSGKKYKNCHLTLDERRNFAVHQPPERSDSPSLPQDLAQLTAFLRAVESSAPKQQRKEFQDLLARTAPIMAYMNQREEIEAASTKLEAHRTEFEKLMDDQDACMKQVHALFSEDRFKPLWFTAADLQRAFESVGFVPLVSEDDQFVEKVRAAILHLANKDRRSEFSMNLLLHLPHYVSQGRFLDGWIIQHCAHNTIEVADDSNPFLFEMFSHGYNAWIEEKRTRDETLLRDVGLDPARLQTMNLDEIDAWIRAQEADPSLKARMEAVMAAHPDQQAQAIANLERMERDSVQLLERDDTRWLLLPREETEPWLPRLVQRFESASQTSPALSNSRQADEAAVKAGADVIWPVMGDMAKSIFTPDRIQQLLSQLRKFRSEQFAAGDKTAAASAMGAILWLEREQEPERNYFLNALCFASIRALISQMAQPGS